MSLHCKKLKYNNCLRLFTKDSFGRRQLRGKNINSFSPVVPTLWIAAFEENGHRFIGGTDLMLPEVSTWM